MGYLPLSRADIANVSSYIFFASDIGGFWHTKYSRALGASNVPDTPDKDEEASARWSHMTVYYDGHVKLSNFLIEVWWPYVNFLNKKWAEG